MDAFGSGCANNHQVLILIALHRVDKRERERVVGGGMYGVEKHNSARCVLVGTRGVVLIEDRGLSIRRFSEKIPLLIISTHSNNYIRTCPMQSFNLTCVDDINSRSAL